MARPCPHTHTHTCTCTQGSYEPNLLLGSEDGEDAPLPPLGLKLCEDAMLDLLQVGKAVHRPRELCVLVSILGSL